MLRCNITVYCNKEKGKQKQVQSPDEHDYDIEEEAPVLVVQIPNPPVAAT